VQGACGTRMPALSSRARRPLPASWSMPARSPASCKVFANTPATVADRRGRAHQGRCHPSRHDHGGSCRRLRRPLGPADREMVGEDLPVMPVDHPLTFFGPYTEFEGTGKDIGYPLLRDQGNSAYMRDTGDPTTAEGGQIEWGYYEEIIRGCAIRVTSWKRTRPAVALAARSRHGAGHRAAGTRHGTDADPGRTRLQ
jgi:hypothetical protein